MTQGKYRIVTSITVMESDLLAWVGEVRGVGQSLSTDTKSGLVRSESGLIGWVVEVGNCPSSDTGSCLR